MNFLSALFLPLMLVTALICGRIKAKYRWIPLLISSCFFDIYGEGIGSVLLGSVILLTWGCAKGIVAAKSPVVRRILLGIPLVWCLGSLFVCKYLGFAMIALHISGVPVPALPIGISFFTFQTLAYVIDVYRGRTQPEKHLGRYALFVSFFPQLVAGPIERSGDLLPQLRAPGTITSGDVREGIWLMLRGYAKKILMADTAAAFVDAVYASPGEASAASVLLAMLLFALQIYGDFSGYSDIALGTARMFGIRLTENFRMPYLAGTLREFWRRWHITLNRWLTDYVYQPLGGSRRGQWVTVRNTMIVFLLSGLWHGAGWNYLLWGGLHGAALSAERLIAPKGPIGRGKRWLSTGLTFGFVCVTWVFFRAGSVSDAMMLLQRLTVWQGMAIWPTIEPLTLLRLAAALAVVWRLDKQLPKAGDHAASAAFLLIAACIWTLLTQAASGIENAFIYFRF